MGVAVAGHTRRAVLAVLVVVLLLQLAPAVPAGAEPLAAGEVADELLVVLTPQGRGQAADIHAKAGGRLKKQAGLNGVQVVKVDPKQAANVKAGGKRDPRVKTVEPNGKVKAAAIPTDPGYAQQWALQQISAPLA